MRKTMKTEVKLHPSTELLNQFVQGELVTGKSVVISAHMELCESCSAKANELQALAVSSWVDPDSVLQSDQSSEADYPTMVAGIVKSPQIKSQQIEALVEVDIDILNHSIKLPKVLAKAASQGLEWKKVAGGISEAQLFLDNETLCEFIYMAPGCQVPVHTHQGSESTLVLDGSFEDELGNFTLGLTNPSTQAELLKVEQWQQKIQLYRDAVSDPGNGILPVSSSWAKKHILGFSDEEIKLDLQQQRIEKAVSAELEKTPEVISKTGVFANIDKLYGNKPGEGGDPMGDETTDSNIGDMGAPPSGGGLDLGGDLGGDLGDDLGGDTDTPTDETPTERMVRNKDLDLLVEDDLIKGKTILDLSKGRESLGEIEKELNTLLNQ